MRNRNPNFSAARTRERLEGKTTKTRETRQAEAFVSRFAVQVLVSCGLVAFAAWQAAPQFGSSSLVSETPGQVSLRESSVYYSGCNAARAAGAAPIHAGEPGYREEMDGDDDGIACEPHRY